MLPVNLRIETEVGIGSREEGRGIGSRLKIALMFKEIERRRI
jgi:hypothetical protein